MNRSHWNRLYRPTSKLFRELMKDKWRTPLITHCALNSYIYKIHITFCRKKTATLAQNTNILIKNVDNRLLFFVLAELIICTVACGWDTFLVFKFEIWHLFREQKTHVTTILIKKIYPFHIFLLILTINIFYYSKTDHLNKMCPCK